MKPTRALCFDLNETLVDLSGSQEAILRTCKRLAEQTGVDSARLFEVNSEVWQSYWPGVEDKWNLGVLSGSAVTLEAWRRALIACGCDDESVAQFARKTHSQHASEALRLFDDVQEVLNLLKPRLSLALITNGASDTQRNTLGILGIAQLFDAIIISGEVGIAKPDASIFALALQTLGVEPEETWHVGDSLGTDVAGALGAGLTAVWLNRAGVIRKENDPRPDYEIRSLRELTVLLSAEA
jgi:putative hydrolase of the HAD superfamily